MMPIYEYDCPRCDERFERLIPLRAEHPTVTCPRCGTHEVRKQMSLFATTGSSQTNQQSHCAPTGG
jgi:putative FmdB family regulatory protein